MSRERRVLVLAKDFPWDGGPWDGMFVLRQVQAFLQLGMSCRVVRIVPHAPPFGRRWEKYRDIPSEYTFENIEVRTLRAVIPPRMLAGRFVARQLHRALTDEVVRFGADLVHVHTVVPGASYAVGLPAPAVVTAHGRDAYEHPWRRPDLESNARTGLCSARAVVCVSEFVRSQVARLGREDAVVIRNGADTRVFRPQDRQASRRRLDLPVATPIIAFAGGLLQAKGVLDLIAAARYLSDLDPLIVFAGDGPERDALQAQAGRVRIRLVGSMPQPQIADLFAAADVVALPSYREGLPAVLCEAMACGRAIVATDVGGIPEIVDDGQSGVLVKPGDVPALAEALRRTLSHARERRRFEDAALAFALAELTWHANAERYARVFEDAIDQRKVS